MIKTKPDATAQCKPGYFLFAAFSLQHTLA